MIWVLFALRLAVGLAVLVVALGTVRAGTPRAAYALAAAAGLDLLFSCCTRGIYSAISAESESLDGDVLDVLVMSGACSGVVQTLLVGGLVIAALALGAREAKPASAAGAGTPPPAVG